MNTRSDCSDANVRRVERAVAVFAKAMLTLLAACALAYLLVATLVYAAREPDPTSLLLPPPDAAPPASPSDFPSPTQDAISRVA